MKKTESEDFRRFDRVMDGLLAVPYTELQRKLKEGKQSKAKRQKRAKASPASRVSSVRKS